MNRSSRRDRSSVRKLAFVQPFPFFAANVSRGGWPWVALACVSVWLALSNPLELAQAQDKYPSRVIKFVIVTSAGGSADIIARLVAEPLKARLSESVIVENRGGAGGNLASALVAGSPADGYTLLVTANNHNVNPLIYGDKAGYQAGDLVPIIQFTEGPSVLVAANNSPFHTLKDVVDAEKANPGSVPLGIAGYGQPVHIAAEIFKLAAGIKLQMVPYKGAGPSLQDVVAGQIPLVISSLAAAMTHISANLARPLAITGKTRWPSLPDVPTIAESGYPTVSHGLWIGLMAPKGTPPAIIERLNHEIREILAEPTLQARLRTMGTEPRGGSPQDFAAMLAADDASARGIVAETKMKVE